MTAQRPDTPAIKLSDDVVLNVGVRGVGPVVVLLHGFTGDASTMDVIATRLEHDFTVVTPNLIGHGGSAGPLPDAYSVESMAAQVVEVLDQLDHLAPVHMVGYSMGGRVALTLACTWPDRVKSLSVIGASAGLATAGERAIRVDADESLAEAIEADGLAAFVDRWMANPLFATQSRLGEERLDAFRAQRLGNDPAELARSLRGAGTGTMRALHGDLETCRVSTRFIVGVDDDKFTGIARDLVSRMPAADAVIVDGAGHAAHLEQPDRVVAAVRSRMGLYPVAVSEIDLPLVAPLSTGKGTTNVRQTLLVALTLDGRTGWGEASPLPGWSVETREEAARAIASIRPELAGFVAAKAGMGPRSLWDGAADLLERIAGTPTARAAVAGAILDLEARIEGVALHVLLADRFVIGDPVVDEVAIDVNALVSDPDPDVVGRQVAAHRADGFRTIKVKVGAVDVDSDVARLTAARAAAGPDLVLRIDANGAWDRDTALAALGRIAASGCDVSLCEEPVTGIDAIASVGRESPIPVAVDESARSVQDLTRVCAQAESGDIAAVVIKPQALGGPDLTFSALDRARQAGIAVIITTMIDSAVGVAHAAHVVAAGQAPGAHGLDTSRLLVSDVAAIAEALPIVDGKLRFQADTDSVRWRAGLGVGAVSLGAVRSS